jgi:hypothetical protein
VRPDPDHPPVGLDKDMSKFEVEDIPRYTQYEVVLDDWVPASCDAASLASSAQ